MDALGSWGAAVVVGHGLVMVLMTLGLVWVMEKVNTWFDRKQRNAMADASTLMVQRQVEAGDFEEYLVSDEESSGVRGSINAGDMWQDCPLYAGNILYARRQHPDCIYRLIVLPPQGTFLPPTSHAAIMDGTHAPTARRTTHNAR